MSTINFTVEDSKVSEVLKALLNSGVTVKDVEITNVQHSKATETLGSSATLCQHDHLTGQNESTSTTAVIPGARFVGGTIFYIDDTADGAYEFFDAGGNPIYDVQVGDRPYYYRVIKKGSKDKHYVYHDEIYSNLRGTYCKDKSYVYESLGTSNDIGSGKTNTEKVMAKDNGAYITEDSDGYPTIWYQLQRIRNAKVGGCDDWFILSPYEVEKLREVIKSGSVTGGTIAGSSYGDSVFNSKWLWSSSEDSDQTAWLWNYSYQFWNNSYKYNNASVFFARAF